MKLRDLSKLMDAGYEIYKIDYDGKAIYKMDKNYDWSIYKKFKTKTAALKEFFTITRKENKSFDKDSSVPTKLLNDGFKVFRRRGSSIYQMTKGKIGAPGWKLLSQHPNAMHAQRAMNTLMINPKHLEG